jgi:transposase-like protein
MPSSLLLSLYFRIKLDEEDLNLITLAQQYSDEGKARALLESLRWPDGPVCPHCKCKEVYKLTPKPPKPSRAQPRKQREGLYCCSACRKQFTVTVGTIFEASHIPISKWMMAVFLVCSSKKGMSAHQLHRMLKITYKSAWFMCHRIRYAMTSGPLAEMLKGVLELDETFVGGKPRFGDLQVAHRGGFRKSSSKAPVVALIQRNGDVRTKVVANVSQKNLHQFVNANIAKGSVVNTDSFSMYHTLLWPIYSVGNGRHDIVNHKRNEYARRNDDGSVAHVNTCESFFSLIKRGIYGSFHHVSKEHLPRYCNEFGFRWNTRRTTDGERMKTAIAMADGKRLTYRQTV